MINNKTIKQDLIILFLTLLVLRKYYQLMNFMQKYRTYIYILHITLNETSTFTKAIFKNWRNNRFTEDSPPP